MRRKNIQRILVEAPRLAAEIQSTLTVDEAGRKVWRPDTERVNNVVLKLARGHLHYELSIYERDEPASLEIVPLPLMSPEGREFFKCPEPEPLAVWPELGSRAFLRALPSGDRIDDDWQEVQEGRYRYLVGQGQGNYVHIVVGEYLACRIVWD